MGDGGDRLVLADQTISSVALICAPRSVLRGYGPGSVELLGRGWLLGQRRLRDGSIPPRDSLLDALPLLRGAELFEPEFEASLAWVRRVVVVVHRESVPGGRPPRSSKRDIPRKAVELPWFGAAA